MPGTFVTSGIAVAIEDRAARSRHAHVAALVVLRRAQELLAVQDLERPQAQEEHGEDRDREHAEDADPQRELRRQPIRLRGARIAAAGSVARVDAS